MNKIGIIGAMEIEVNLLQEQLEQCRITEKAGMWFFEGLLCGVPLLTTTTGMPHNTPS